jgi:hypothetical protein
MMKILRQLSYFMLFILLVSACKKDDITSEQWSTKAEEKRAEIDQLIASEKCENLTDWSIDKVDNFWCGHSYFPVHKNIKTQFNKLWKEYLTLTSKSVDAGIREGIIYEPCEEYILHHSEPTQLTCDNGKVKLLYIKDLSLEDSKARIAPLKTKIDNYLSNLTCSGTENWATTILLNDCGIDHIPYIRTADVTELKKDIALYNSLKANILEREKTNCPTRKYTYPKGVKCINSKPVVELSE